MPFGFWGAVGSAAPLVLPKEKGPGPGVAGLVCHLRGGVRLHRPCQAAERLCAVGGVAGPEPQLWPGVHGHCLPPDLFFISLFGAGIHHLILFPTPENNLLR